MSTASGVTLGLVLMLLGMNDPHVVTKPTETTEQPGRTNALAWKAEP